MITLYIEPEKIEELALFEDEIPHWNKIIKSGIHLCLNTSEEELNVKFTDELDPLYIAYNSSGTMQLPIASENYIKEIKKDLTKTVEKPNAIFVLNVDENDAKDIKSKQGVALYNCEDLPSNLFSNSFFQEFDKNSEIEEGWKGIIQFDRPPSNSLIIADNYFFQNEDRGENRGISNLPNFLNAYLPDFLDIEYHVTIVAPNSRQKSNDWWIKEYGKLVTKIRALRKYNIHIELVLSKSEIHKRRIISNYIIGKADKGFDIFSSDNTKKVKEENDFEHLEVFSNLDNSGTKHFESASKLINQLQKHCNNISEYVAANNNQLDRSLFGCNSDKTIKNRLLN